MILRKVSFVCMFLLVAVCNAEDNPKTYDTSEWIPISPQKTDVEETGTVIERKATGRVLNLADPPQSNFFPDDKKPRFLNQNQQFHRETTNINPYQQQQQGQGQRHEVQQPVRQHKVKPAVGHPYRFENIIPPPPPPSQRTRIQQQKPEATQQKYFVQQQQPKEYINPQFIQQQSKQEFNNQFIQPQPQQQQIKFNPPNFAPGQPQFAAQTGGPFFPRPQQEQPQEYHTIPEEYLNAQGLQQQAPQFFQQNYQNLPDNIPEFPPIRLNASYASIREAIEKEKVKPNSKLVDTPKEEKENVQLLYVPLESLQQQQQQQQQQKGKNDLPKLHAYQQAPDQIIQQQFLQRPPQFVHRQQQIQNIENDFAHQALEAHKLQLQFQGEPQFQEQPQFQALPQFEAAQQFQSVPQQFQGAQYQIEPQNFPSAVEEQRFEQPYALPIIETTTQPIITTTSTTKRSTSKKRKPHQPPLAVYMGGAEHADVADVLTLLRDAKTIDVQDTVGPNSPKIFVGPSTLDAPHGYAKFELPYLSSLDNNRVERKVDQYPFFVAPLSYKAPPGFSKIPLPSPHVGSVVIKENLLSKPSTSQRPIQQNIEEYIPAQRIRTQTTRVVEPYTLPPISTSERYSKPIPEEHVINQFELDEINGFIPQFQLQPTAQEIPEKYSFEVEPTRGYTPHERGTSPAPQQYLKEVIQPTNNYAYDSSSEEVRPTQQTRTRPTVATQTTQFEQHVHKSNRPAQYHIRQRPKVTSQEDTSAEVSSEEKYNNYELTRPHHKSRRPTTTTSAPQEQYFKEVTRSSTPAPPQEQYFKELTRSSTPAPPQEHYFKEVTRSSSPAPPPQEQYFKEITRSSSAAPPQQNQYFESSSAAPQEQYFKEVSSPAPQEQYFKEVTPQEYHTRSSTTPTTEQFVSSAKPVSEQYSPRPTQLSYSPTQDVVTSTQQSHRPELDHSKFNVIDEYTNKATNKNAYGSSEEQENVYKQPSSSEEQDYAQQPVYSPTASSIHRQNQHILNQHMMDSVILGQRQQDNYVSGPQQIYEQSVLNHPQRDAAVVQRVRNQYRPDSSYEEEINVKTQNANVDNYNLSPQLPPVSQQLPGLINSLEDHLEEQSVRLLLSPGLYPTSEKPSQVTIHITTPAPTYPPTTTSPPTTTPSYPSTHLPIVEKTTQRVLRGRQRAGTRYSSTTPSSVSTTRRTVQRGRRPLPPRTRHSEESTTEYVPTTARTVTSNRQRFRTRGRPTTAQSDIISDRVSTTERHTYEIPSRTTERQYEQATNRQQTATARLIDVEHAQQYATPKVTINDEEEQYVINNYQPAYNAAVEHSNVLPVSPKVVNVEVTRPQVEVTRARTEPAVIQEINQLPIRNLEEHQTITERPSVRIRNRVRTRPTRPSHSTTEEAPNKRGQPAKEESNDEFYGFFRQPNFKSSTDAPTQTTPSSRSVYSSTYVSSTLKPLIQYPDESIVHASGSKYASREEEVESSPAPVRFVGELRPKYASTAPYFEVTQPSLATERVYQTSERVATTEAPKVKIRGRVRIPGRRPSVDEAETPRSNELVKEETSVRTPVRGRVRGKTQYKPPSKPKDSVEDEDVEGGNYPVNYRKATPRPSFQITVDPATVDDQEPYSSQYRPTYVTKEAGSKVVQPWVEDLSAYRHANELPEDNKSSSTTEESPNALPIILTSTTEEMSTTTESVVEKLVEEIAELADEELQSEDEQNQTSKTQTFEEPSDTFKTFATFEESNDDTNKDDLINEEYLTTDAPEIETTTKKRRGIWKLVKRPLDGLQSAESQNLGQAKVNSFVSEEKTEANKFHIFEDSKESSSSEITTTPTPEVTTASIVTTTEEGFLNSLYEMFGLPNKDATKQAIKDDETTESPVDILEDTTDALIPTTTKTILQEVGVEEELTTTQNIPLVNSSSSNEEFPENTPSSLNFVTPMSLETWNKGVVKTLTSTEISHETEICYKGRCVKSKEMKVPAS